MLELFPWIPFLVAITLLTLTPGVDTMMVLRRSISSQRQGFLASLGICLGLFVHGALSALGVSAILASSETLFMFMQIIGAGYLIYLSLHAFKDFWKGRALVLESVAEPSAMRSAFYQGFLNNLLNPKTLLFYMALLPQFLVSGYSPLLQSLMMALIHFCIAMVWQGGLVLGVHRARHLLFNRGVVRALDGLSGSVYLLFGLRLILGERN
ncbi:MAG: Homoserine/homoserine lactone efflux protein [Marinobacterium sp. xm-d-530]|nr:MAG: Homoserine/homoserine lactone efflux protein [Marinobacterium sp. xm-d-530]